MGNTSLTVAKGSITDVSKGNDTALTMLDAKLVLICDRSGSMEQHDAVGGRARYEVEDEIVSDFQKKYPGQVVLIGFADSSIMCLNGVLPYPSGGTNISIALNAAAPLVKVGMRAVLLSDGEPSDGEHEVFNAAQQLRGKLDFVFIGPDISQGRGFFERLAKSVQGSLDVNDLKKPELLRERLDTLMLKAG